MSVLKRPRRSVARRIIQNGNRRPNKPKFGQNRPFFGHISSKKDQNELQKCSKMTFFPYYTRYGYETLKRGPWKQPYLFRSKHPKNDEISTIPIQPLNNAKMTIPYLLRSKSFGGPGQFCPLFRLNYVIFDPKSRRFYYGLRKHPSL
jgi:hypothetical protein